MTDVSTWPLWARILISPLLFLMASLFCIGMAAIFAFVAWPVGGVTTMRISWSEDDD